MSVGTGSAHMLSMYTDPINKLGRHAINIGVASSEYQNSVSPDGTEQEVVDFLKSLPPDVVRSFLLKKGYGSPCGLYDLWDFSQLREALKKEEHA